MALSSAVSACEPENIRLTEPVELTDTEKAFVAAQPPLKVASIFAPPLTRSDAGSDGYQGISADVFCFIASQIGLDYEFVSQPGYSLTDHLTAVQQGQIDMFMPLSFQASRAEKGLFSDGYYQSYYVAIIDQARRLKITHLADMDGYRVGVVGGSALESVLRANLPHADIVALNDSDPHDIYQPLLKGQIDVLVHNRNFFKEERYSLGVFNLVSVYTLHDYPRTYRYYFSPTEAHQQLIDIFNRYLAHIDTIDSVIAHELGEKNLIDQYVLQRSVSQLFEVAIGLGAVLILVMGYWLQKYRLLNASLVSSHQHIAEQQSRLKATNKELDMLSKTDPLTGLYNKRHFELMVASLSGEAGQSLPFSLMLIDVDRFKRVNDHYGHITGDDYLRIIGEIIRKHVSRRTDVAARYGGEEFACLLPATPASDAYALAERIREAVVERRLPNIHGEGNIVTLSIGIATASTGVWHQDTLLAEADQQLYAAKKAGRNITCSIER